MNFTALCFGYEKTVFDYSAKPPKKFRLLKNGWERYFKRVKRRFLKHKVKRYTFAKKELCLWGSVKAGIVYYKQYICKNNRWMRRKTVPWYSVDERGKLIEVF